MRQQARGVEGWPPRWSIQNGVVSNRYKHPRQASVVLQPSAEDGAEPVARWVEWPSPIRDGGWVDADGNRWRARGGPVPSKRAARLLHSPQVRVLLFYGLNAPTEVILQDREALWQRIGPYLRQRVVRVKDDHTDFVVAEFKDDRHRSVVIIEEFC
jgi:hypothetical protein